MKKQTNLPTSSSYTPLSKADKRIERLFSRFAAFYGHVWRSQFKQEDFLIFAKKEWQEGLSDFSDETMNQAVQYCRDKLEMPPTLPQFIEQCRQVKKLQHEEVKEVWIPARPEIVRLHIAKCKQLLNKENS